MRIVGFAVFLSALVISDTSLADCLSEEARVTRQLEADYQRASNADGICQTGQLMKSAMDKALNFYRQCGDVIDPSGSVTGELETARNQAQQIIYQSCN